MTVSVSACCIAHRENFPAREPQLTRLRNKDELLQIGSDEGLFEFSFPAPADWIYGEPPLSDQDQSESQRSKYLWVVASETLPVALEIPSNGTALTRGSVSHTNLTGGAEAHTGGEMWYCNDSRIMINGGSSRYTPRNLDELISVAIAIKEAAHKAGLKVEVAQLGFDGETNRFHRSQTASMTWV